MSLLNPSILGLDFAGGNNLLTRDLAQLGILPPQWGLYTQGGSVAVTADTVISFEYKQEWTLSDYPLEQGAFESYDKVQTPYTVRLTFASGGSFSNRQALLNSIAAVAGTLTLYDVVTPEKTYLSCNIMHIDLSRKADKGVGLIMVDVWLMQINVTTTDELNATAMPSGADTTNGGQVQPAATSPGQSAAVIAAFNQPATQGSAFGPGG